VTDHRDMDLSDLAPESRETDAPDPPATSAALAAFSLGLEEKLIEHMGHRLERHHQENLTALREGQNKLLEQYAKDSSGHRAQLSQTIATFTDWAGRALIDLQVLTHATHNLVSAHELQLYEQDQRLAEIEKLQAQLSEFRSQTIDRLNELEKALKAATAAHADNPAGR
jgi:hypothetical protein